jgi:hypothetical protein
MKGPLRAITVIDSARAHIEDKGDKLSQIFRTRFLRHAQGHTVHELRVHHPCLPCALVAPKRDQKINGRRENAATVDGIK